MKLHCAAEGCGEAVANTAPRVVAGFKVYHLNCYMTPRLEAEFRRGVEHTLSQLRQAEEIAAEQAAAKLKAAEEIATAKRLAEQNVKLEKERVANLVKVEREKLAKAEQGEAKDRFALLDMDE